MIDGRTQLVGLIGWPVKHSLSPVMHNAAFAALCMNWRYVPLPVVPGQITQAVRGLPALGFRGANVTAPYKQTVLPLLDSVSPAVQALGAVNTILIEYRNGNPAVVKGDNTDAQGFTAALQHEGFDTSGWKRTVVVGAGGGARAIVFGLLQGGEGEILLLNRTLHHAQALISDLGCSTQAASSRLHACPLTPETLVEAGRTADLLVNATTVGMWPDVKGSIWPAAIPVPSHLAVFDLVYMPQETRLLAQARESGAHAISGLEMLVRQGALAFKGWTGRSAPLAGMRSACERALSKPNRSGRRSL